MSRIPVDKLRAEVDAAGIDAYELAAELGWRDKRGWIDAERVKRILGQHTYQAGRRAPQARQGVNYATAQRIREALRAHAAPSQTEPGQNTAATGERRPGPGPEGSTLSAPEPDRTPSIPPPQNTSPDPSAPCAKNIQAPGDKQQSP